MHRRRKYLRKARQFVVAVRIDLDTPGLEYRKWGAKQRANRGDWLVDNDGEVYTVEARSFARTYKKVRQGIYAKITPVWARIAREAGSIETKEGRSHYRPGDFIVSNQSNGGDGYCMTPAKFKAMYRPARLSR